jgi:hypothetical protein
MFPNCLETKLQNYVHTTELILTVRIFRQTWTLLLNFKKHFALSLDNLSNFSNLRIIYQICICKKKKNVLIFTFHAVKKNKNEAQMRQQNSFFFEKKDGCLFASTNSAISCLRQQNFLHQLLGLIWRNNSQIVPKMDY